MNGPVTPFKTQPLIHFSVIMEQNNCKIDWKKLNQKMQVHKFNAVTRKMNEQTPGDAKLMRVLYLLNYIINIILLFNASRNCQ